MGNLKAAFAAFFASTIALQVCLVQGSFADSCHFYWGADRGRFTDVDHVELGLVKSGGSGIKSNVSYMYGAVTAEIKLVPGNSAGTVATFYLSSSGDKHDEIDFEFLGNSTGEPYTIHTNIFTQGFGKREQQFKPWFNPTDEYHNYTIFWNPNAVVWLIDYVPIRVFRNYHDSEINFPDTQPMKAYASLWNADDWATQGGKVKTDWSLAPFAANFRNYKADACSCTSQTCVAKCSSHNLANWWTNPMFSQLNEIRYNQMKWINDNYMIYNYCTDSSGIGKLPKECNLRQF